MSYDKPPFKITYRAINTYGRIMNKLGEIKAYKSLERLPHLRKQNRIKSIYSSCAIEANSLSLNQVTDIINGKHVIGDKKEILEIKNAIRAYDIIEEINPYDLNSLLKIHSILTNGLIDRPGKYRLNAEGVFDGDKCIFIAPPANLVPSLMENLYLFLNDNKDKIPPIILSAIFHYEFVFIHPFQDGNGRAARYIETAILAKFNEIFYWIPIENEIKKHQTEYYMAINKANSDGESTVFIEFMLDLIDKALDDAIIQIERETIKKSIYVERLINVMSPGEALSANELLERLDLKSKENLRKNYLNPALEAKLIELEIKSKPTSKNQRYIRL